MILPVYLYGHPVIRKVAEPITADYPDLQKLIADMYETMYATDGIGLAAARYGHARANAVNLRIAVAVQHHRAPCAQCGRQ